VFLEHCEASHPSAQSEAWHVPCYKQCLRILTQMMYCLTQYFVRIHVAKCVHKQQQMILMWSSVWEQTHVLVTGYTLLNVFTNCSSSMQSNVWERTHHLLLSTPCWPLHSFCTAGAGFGVATRVTLTSGWESMLHRGGPAADFSFVL
jgi:hypothetical protein